MCFIIKYFHWPPAYCQISNINFIDHQGQILWTNRYNHLRYAMQKCEMTFPISLDLAGNSPWAYRRASWSFWLQKCISKPEIRRFFLAFIFAILISYSGQTTDQTPHKGLAITACPFLLSGCIQVTDCNFNWCQNGDHSSPRIECLAISLFSYVRMVNSWCLTCRTGWMRREGRTELPFPAFWSHIHTPHTSIE